MPPISRYPTHFPFCGKYYIYAQMVYMIRVYRGDLRSPTHQRLSGLQHNKHGTTNTAQQTRHNKHGTQQQTITNITSHITAQQTQLFV